MLLAPAHHLPPSARQQHRPDATPFPRSVGFGRLYIPTNYPIPHDTTLLTSSLAALPPGEKKFKATNPVILNEVRSEWNAMTGDEKTAAVTAEDMARLQDGRDNRKHAAHNVPINAFQDTQASLKTIEREVRFFSVFVVSIY